VAASSILCVLIGTALFFPLIRFNGEKIDSGNLPHSLESTQWHTRVEALKFIEKKKIEIREFAAYQSIRSSSRAAEVYWFVKTLGSSRHHETYKDLLTFLDFPDPNVVRMAFYALGQRGKREAVSIILKRIETSDSWYNQWYAYRALKALGWKQTKSN
ncbi:MAG TPA: HEAT repeat domain-containing protein, partial [Methanosarcinaceae archaeon]|nr:HEAT repeat domain-containing protein [Methanosarcinaceae archaeon]